MVVSFISIGISRNMVKASTIVEQSGEVSKTTGGGMYFNWKEAILQCEISYASQRSKIRQLLMGVTNF